MINNKVLVNALNKIQVTRKLNDAALSRLVGLSQSEISRIKSNERGVGMKTALNLYLALPELHDILFKRRP